MKFKTKSKQLAYRFLDSAASRAKRCYVVLQDCDQSVFVRDWLSFRAGTKLHGELTRSSLKAITREADFIAKSEVYLINLQNFNKNKSLYLKESDVLILEKNHLSIC